METFIIKYIEKLSNCGHGKLESYTYNENTQTLIIDFAFRGWYDREKIIDNVYTIIKINRKEYHYSPYEITLKSKKICNVKINWRNLTPNDEVPEIMQNLLSGISYSQYRKF